jgi:hypothetical protein
MSDLKARENETIHAMTLRLPEGLYEVIRKRAFDERTSITAQIVVALREQFGAWGLGCDVCGRAHVEVSTPGGFRFCAEHSAKSTDPES